MMLLSRVGRLARRRRLALERAGPAVKRQPAVDDKGARRLRKAALAGLRSGRTSKIRPGRQDWSRAGRTISPVKGSKVIVHNVPVVAAGQPLQVLHIPALT